MNQPDQRATYDVVVIGGGIVGASTAYHLVKAGVNTLLIDRNDAGKATNAGAGILVSASRKDNVPPWHRLMGAAFDFYPTLIARLAADNAHDTGFAQCGMLIVARSEDEIEPFEATRCHLQAQQHATKPSLLCEISPKDASERFPPLADVYGAIYDPTATRIDGRRLAASLLQAAQQDGLSICQGSVTQPMLKAGRVTGVHVDSETVACGKVVIASGAWSRAIGAQLGVQTPVAPQRGQIVHLDLPQADTAAWPIVEGFRGHYILCFPNGHIVAGATRETDSGFRPTTTAAGITEVMNEALRVAPGLATASLREFRVGLRPMPADGLPILGPLPHLANVVLATGHGPNGLQLGPYSGKIAADFVLDQHVDSYIDAFRVARFT